MPVQAESAPWHIGHLPLFQQVGRHVSVIFDPLPLRCRPPDQAGDVDEDVERALGANYPQAGHGNQRGHDQIAAFCVFRTRLAHEILDRKSVV